jgi:COMPASS component SPP1
MRTRIEAWEKKGGKREKLWEIVRGAEKREGVVVCAEEGDSPGDTGAGASAGDGVVKMEVDGEDKKVKVKVEEGSVKKKGKAARERELLHARLAKVVRVRERIKGEVEVARFRERLVGLASQRAQSVGLCGWDQRLCFEDEEWAEFGPAVWESYGCDEGGSEVKEGAGVQEDEGEWWCVGKKVCERHAG